MTLSVPNAAFVAEMNAALYEGLRKHQCPCAQCTRAPLDLSKLQAEVLGIDWDAPEDDEPGWDANGAPV